MAAIIYFMCSICITRTTKHKSIPLCYGLRIKIFRGVFNWSYSISYIIKLNIENGYEFLRCSVEYGLQSIYRSFTWSQRKVNIPYPIYCLLDKIAESTLSVKVYVLNLTIFFHTISCAWILFTIHRTTQNNSEALLKKACDLFKLVLNFSYAFSTSSASSLPKNVYDI